MSVNKFEAGKKYLYKDWKTIYTCVYSQDDIVCFTYEENKQTQTFSFNLQTGHPELKNYREYVKPEIYKDTHHLYLYMTSSGKVFETAPFEFSDCDKLDKVGYRYVTSIDLKLENDKLFINGVQIPIQGETK